MLLTVLFTVKPRFLCRGKQSAPQTVHPLQYSTLVYVAIVVGAAAAVQDSESSSFIV